MTAAEREAHVLRKITSAASAAQRAVREVATRAHSAEASIRAGERLGSGMATAGAVFGRYANDADAATARLMAMIETAYELGIEESAILAAYRAGGDGHAL